VTKRRRSLVEFLKQVTHPHPADPRPGDLLLDVLEEGVVGRRPLPTLPVGIAALAKRPEPVKPVEPEGRVETISKIRQATGEGQDQMIWALSIARNARSRERIAAINWLADRGWGKGPTELTLNEGLVIQFQRPGR
jgi:hypothetical protein